MVQVNSEERGCGGQTLKALFIVGNGDEGFMPVVAESSSKAKMVYFESEYCNGVDYIDIRVSKKKFDVSKLPEGLIEDESLNLEFLKAGVFGVIMYATCPTCKTDTEESGVWFDEDKFMCNNCCDNDDWKVVGVKS